MKTPWPGMTVVSLGRARLAFSVAKSPLGRSVRPIEPQNRVSPRHDVSRRPAQASRGHVQTPSNGIGIPLQSPLVAFSSNSNLSPTHRAVHSGRLICFVCRSAEANWLGLLRLICSKNYSTILRRKSCAKRSKKSNKCGFGSRCSVS